MFLVFSVVVYKNKVKNGNNIIMDANFNIYYAFCSKIVVLICKSG